MTIIEKITDVFVDEDKTQTARVRSWEISGTELPREKNLPVRLAMTGCAPIYMLCSHQDADVFLAFPISARQYLKLMWHRIWQQWRSLGRTNKP